jgi:hypothetical protein
MERKFIFFEWNNNPKNFIDTSNWLFDYLIFLHNELGFVCDQLLIFPEVADFVIKSSEELGSIIIRERFSNLLLKLKLNDIKKYHGINDPDLNFSEDVGNVITVRTLNKGSKKLIFYFYIGGVRETLMIEGFKNLNNNFPFISFFKMHCTYLKPLYGYLAASTIQKQQQLPEYFFGWMSYFSNDILLPPIPSDYEIEEVANQGKILITTKDDFDAVKNPEHYQKAMRLVELFREYNIVRPL